MNKEQNYKQAIRKQILTLCKNTSSDTRKEWSEAICSLLLHTLTQRHCKTIMLFHPLHDEPDITPLLQQHNYTIILPTIEGDQIIPRQFLSNQPLTPGSFNIKEPNTPPFQGEIDLIVIPGRAFDSNGGRIGRGKGFYDRFLKTHPNAIRVGIAYPFQLLQTPIEMSPHDQYIDILITPMKTLITSPPRLNH